MISSLRSLSTPAWAAALILGILSPLPTHAQNLTPSSSPSAITSSKAPPKILFVGNSITKHGPKPDIDWHSDWGMAASAEENDYVHRVVAGVAKAYGKMPEFMIRNVADVERQYDKAEVVNRMKNARDFGADIIILAIGENVPALATDKEKKKFQSVIELMLNGLKGDRNPKFIVRSSFWPNAAKDAALEAICKTVGGTFVNISELGKNEANYARAERSYKNAGVGNHPGDRGMVEIADAILKAMPTP